LDDVFDIQDKVASKITEALRMTLTADEKTTLQKRYTGNIEAFQLYLQGRYFWSKRNETAFHTAIRFFEKAIEKDPNYALAYAGLAHYYNLLGEYTNYSRKDLYPKAKAAVKKAIELDNQLAEAHISLASILMLNEWDWEAAEREFKIGIELDSNYATAYHWYSELLLFTGRPDQGIMTIELASQLDPVSMAILKDLGISYYYARQYDKALEKAMATMVLDPDFITVHRLLSLCYHAMGEYDLALAENEKWGKMTHSTVKTLLAKAMILASAGKKEEAKAAMEEMHAIHSLGQNDNRSMALIYVALGEFDVAFEWLQKALDAREESLCSLKVDPKLDAVRNDPRFNDIVRKIGLPV
jgi:Tfp pilus assembly protein PilF